MANRQCTFNIQLVTVKEVLDIITSLNNSSSTGIDFIDTQTIKLVKYEIVEAVTEIFNLSIETSTFPSIYKHSQIILLKKKPTLRGYSQMMSCAVGGGGGGGARRGFF